MEQTCSPPHTVLTKTVATFRTFSDELQLDKGHPGFQAQWSFEKLCTTLNIHTKRREHLRCQSRQCNVVLSGQEIHNNHVFCLELRDILHGFTLPALAD